MPFGQAWAVPGPSEGSLASRGGEAGATGVCSAVDGATSVDATPLELGRGCGAGCAAAAFGSSGRPAQPTRQAASDQVVQILARVTLGASFTRTRRSGPRSRRVARGSNPPGARQRRCPQNSPPNRSGRRLRRIEHDVRRDLFQTTHADALHSQQIAHLFEAPEPSAQGQDGLCSLGADTGQVS